MNDAAGPKQCKKEVHDVSREVLTTVHPPKGLQEWGNEHAVFAPTAQIGDMAQASPEQEFGEWPL